VKDGVAIAERDGASARVHDLSRTASRT